MRWLISVAVLAGCAPNVYVPPTPEGNACSRECMGLYNVCRVSRGSVPCGNQQAACLQTCPGAATEGQVAEQHPERQARPEREEIAECVSVTSQKVPDLMPSYALATCECLSELNRSEAPGDRVEQCRAQVNAKFTPEQRYRLPEHLRADQ